MLGDAEAVEAHGGVGAGVFNGSGFGQFLVHAGDALEFIEVERAEAFAKSVPVLTALLDESAVDEAGIENVAAHHVQQRHVGAGPELEVILGVGDEFDLAWIDDDHRYALHGALFDLRSGDRVPLGGIGTDDHDAGRVVQILDGVRGGTGAEALLHAEGGRAVADAGAAVDVVVADHRAHEFLHEVVFLIGAAGGGNTGDGLGTVFLADALQVFDDVIVGLVPSGFFEVAVGADEWRAEAVAMVVETEGEPALQAGVGVVHLGIRGGLNGKHLVALGGDGEIATDATVGTDGAGFRGGLDRLGLEDVRDGGSWAGLGAGTAGDAGRVLERGVEALDDAGVEAATVHAEHELALHFVAGADAAGAVDALRQVRRHVGVGQVLFAVEVVRPIGIADVTDAYLGGDGLQFAVAVHLAGEAVERVVGQHELDDVFSQSTHLG